MSTPDRHEPASAPTPAVLAAVVARDATHLAEALDAVAAQVYGLLRTVVVGGVDAARVAAEERGLEWIATVGQLAADLPVGVSHVWLLHDDARPSRSALLELMEEAQRVDASVAGSKLLKADNPSLLESVGGATDVFGVPYSGLEPDEKDQQQYDVVRDVAFVSGASVLVRRDLFRGLRGTDTLLAPHAAGMDLSQRAHITGGRVVIVPSSVVLHHGACLSGVAHWREQAGWIRTTMKVYRLVTLVWVLPLAFLTGLLHSLIATFVDRRRALLDWVMAWAWNAYHLPSTIAGRRRLRRSRLLGDEELFRYQVRGSALLRQLGDQLGSRVAPPRDEPGRLTDLVDRGRGFWQHPGFYAALAGAGFLALAGRSLVSDGLPVAGLSLPLPESAWATLRSYAGGWNTAGLGSPAPLHPAVGATAVAQLVMASRAGLTSTVFTIGAAACGLIGTARLLRRLGVGPLARYTAGLALLGGPATRALASEADWPGVIAVGVAPWAVAAFLVPWPSTRMGRLGYVARTALVVGGLAVFAPVALAVPLVVLTVRALIVEDGGWGAVLRSLPGTLLAVPFLFPWLYWISARSLFEGGEPQFFTPSVWSLAAFTAALGLVLAVSDRRLAGLAAWGGVLAMGGALAARTTELGVGREPSVAGLVVSALGTALVVAAAIDLSSRLSEAGLWRKITGRGAAVGGVVVAAGALLLIPGGRLGLPVDQFGTQLRFAVARAQDHGADRLLVAGPEGSLPGESRRADGFAYRVVSGTGPTLPEGWLPAPREGDRALDSLLAGILEGGRLRPGSDLAAFGIRWVVLTGPTPLEAAFEAQLDLRRLPGLDYVVYENDVFSPRAVGSDGAAWVWDRPDYSGSPGTGPVYVAENADHRWGVDSQPAEWANLVEPDGGLVAFAGDVTNRNLALGAGGLLLVLLVAAFLGRERTS